MRIFTTSLGHEPRLLASGRDLVLDIDIAHGDRLAEGVFAHDLLDMDDRRRADALSVAALAEWRADADRRMTVDGICWSWIWEWTLHNQFFPWVHRALALRRAVERHRPSELTLMDADPYTRDLAHAVADELHVTVRTTPDARAPRPAVDPPARPSFLKQARRRVLAGAPRIGVPSVLRRDSVLFLSYWPLEPLLDTMLAQPQWRPAVTLDRLPTGARRWLGAATQGGFVGLPGPRDSRRARAHARELAAQVPGCDIGVDGLDLSLLFRRVLTQVIDSEAGTMALAPVLRRAFGRGRIRQVLGAYDSDPGARLAISLAREAGIPTLCLAHGAYCVPQTLRDLDVCDEAAIWTEAVAPLMEARGRPVHVVGYPHPTVPERRVAGPPPRPTVVVLGQYAVAHTAMMDKRLTASTWRVAVDAIRHALPDARIVLRPHPFERFATDSPLTGRFGGSDLVVDRTTPVTTLLERANLLLGGTSTATLQAALVDCPTIALNLSGFDWPWPWGGDTAVPVARSAGELRDALARFAADGRLPGAEDCLAALGIGGRDAVATLLEVLSQNGVSRPASASATPSSSSTG